MYNIVIGLPCGKLDWLKNCTIVQAAGNHAIIPLALQEAGDRKIPFSIIPKKNSYIFVAVDII